MMVFMVGVDAHVHCHGCHDWGALGGLCAPVCNSHTHCTVLADDALVPCTYLVGAFLHVRVRMGLCSTIMRFVRPQGSTPGSTVMRLCAALCVCACAQHFTTKYWRWPDAVHYAPVRVCLCAALHHQVLALA